MTTAPRPGSLHPWIERCWSTPSGALVAEASTGLDPATVFARLSDRRHAIWLDSALADGGAAEAAGPRLGRHSFVAADPIHSIEVAADGSARGADVRGFAGAIAAVRGMLADLSCATIPGLPPFQGGLAGLLSYECGLAALGIEPPAERPAGVPLLSLHAYDVVFAHDHDLGRGWFISQGVPARGPEARRSRAANRLEAVLAGAGPAASPGGSRGTVGATGAAHSPPGHAAVSASHSPEDYRRMVRSGVDYVRSGDIFQANLAQRFALPVAVDPRVLYARARELNPAPFAGYFDAGGVRLASMSPERFLQVRGRLVRMHPIKGTRRVIASPEADLFAGDDLEASAKDRAENVMIVDLVRNDLSRACTPESVRVEALCRLERYRYVQHLVSIVSGRLRPGLSGLDAVLAAIPAGSVTGAPKHRACEIISELEGRARGAYCGSLGYLGFDGAVDLNLLIRTFVVGPDGVSFAAGGGVTSRSDPAAEHAESLHKAEGMLRVVESLELAAPEPRA